MWNTSVKVAFLVVVILAFPNTSFALATGQEEATGRGEVPRPNAAAIRALARMPVDPSGTGRAFKIAPIPPPRMSVPTIPRFQ
jgi:hypothetical protein